MEGWTPPAALSLSSLRIGGTVGRGVSCVVRLAREASDDCGEAPLLALKCIEKARIVGQATPFNHAQACSHQPFHATLSLG